MNTPSCCVESFFLNEIFIIFLVLSSRMPERKTRKKRPVKPVIDLLPELLVNALARHDDFIVTCETDPGTGKKMIHIISGKFVTPCMLRKLLGQAEAQRDEGSSVVSREWI
jgi:hypothetical protein